MAAAHQQLGAAAEGEARPFPADLTHHRRSLAEACGPARVAAMSDRQALAEAAKLRNDLSYGSPHPAGGVIPERIRRVPGCPPAPRPGTLIDMSRLVRRYRRMLRHLQHAQSTAAFA
jgi:hypothetical protein